MDPVSTESLINQSFKNKNLDNITAFLFTFESYIINSQNRVEDQQEAQLEIINKSLQYNEQILEKVSPKNKIKRKDVPQRDALTFVIFEDIMNAPRPKKAHARAFKITCSILFFCDLRWDKVALLNRENIEEIINQTKLSIYQKKVDKFRNVRFIEKSISFIKKAFEQHGDNVFADNWAKPNNCCAFFV